MGAARGMSPGRGGTDRPMRGPTSRRLALAALPTLLALGLVVEGVRGASAAGPEPDFGFFREKIEPVLQAVCAQCHAGKGQGQFAIVARPPGATIPEAESFRTFQTVLKLLVPGKPEQSKFLLKPLAERDGGVKHGGNDRIFKGTPAYRAWVDFIEGAKGSASASSNRGTPGQPDFGYFLARIEPVLLSVCAQCHAAPGKGQFSLVVHTAGARFPLADHRKNYETVLRLLVPGKPDESRFLQKPYADRPKSWKHGGGDRIQKGDANHKAWVEFILGIQGPPPPVEAPPEPEAPAVGASGLVLEAEAMQPSGDAEVVAVEGGGTIVAPGAGGGRLQGTFRASRRADHVLSFRVRAAERGFRFRLDDGEFIAVDGPKDGATEVVPRLPLDAGRPLDGRRGRLELKGPPDDPVLAMDGREGTARWLSPADLPHTKVRASVGIPGEDEPGRDDAWLLFDCLDAENGKFFGLADGGRRAVMGVIESGMPSVVRSVAAPAVGGTAPVELGVDLLDGVAVGRIDGKPVLHANFDRHLGAARFGVLTHGVVVVRSLTALRGADEVHRTRFSAGGVFHLTRGTHRVEVDLLPQGAAIDAVTVKEVSE